MLIVEQTTVLLNFIRPYARWKISSFSSSVKRHGCCEVTYRGYTVKCFYQKRCSVVSVALAKWGLALSCRRRILLHNFSCCLFLMTVRRVVNNLQYCAESTTPSDYAQSKSLFIKEHIHPGLPRCCEGMTLLLSESCRMSLVYTHSTYGARCLLDQYPPCIKTISMPFRTRLHTLLSYLWLRYVPLFHMHTA